MIDLPMVIYALSHGIKINIGTPGNFEDCAMGGESVVLLRRLLDLW
jgi:hypothetical protein